MVMSKLLEQAVNEASRQSLEEQETIAALILEEIMDEQEWERQFTNTKSYLADLGEKALQQVREGKTREVET